MKDNYADAVKFRLQDSGMASNRLWAYGVFCDYRFSEEQKSLELLDLYCNQIIALLHSVPSNLHLTALTWSK